MKGTALAFRSMLTQNSGRIVVVYADVEAAGLRARHDGIEYLLHDGAMLGFGAITTDAARESRVAPFPHSITLLHDDGILGRPAHLLSSIIHGRPPPIVLSLSLYPSFVFCHLPAKCLLPSSSLASDREGGSSSILPALHYSCGLSYFSLSRFISVYFLSQNTIHSTSPTLFIRSAKQAHSPHPVMVLTFSLSPV